MSTSSTRDRLLVVGTREALHNAAELIAAHRAHRRVRTIPLGDDELAGAWWNGRLGGVRAVIVLADAAAAASDMVPGTHLNDGDAQVPVGVMPVENRALHAAAAVQARGDSAMHGGPVVVLNSREARASVLAAGLADALEGRIPMRQLPTGRLSRSALVGAFALGPGVALYVGEGHGLGWGGYGGLQAWELDVAGARPAGAVLSLTCWAAYRMGSTPSFSETLVQRGIAAAALGAAAATPHVANAALAEAITARIVDGALTLADALPPGAPELDGYVICGDPLAPFVGARGSRAGLARVYAPAVGEELPPVDWHVQSVEATTVPTPAGW